MTFNQGIASAVGAIVILVVGIRLWLRHKKADAQRTPPVSEAKSYLYVSLWMYWYKFKTMYLGTVVAVVLLILSGIELIGPLTHLLPEQAMKIRAATAGLLFIAAAGMLWHHHLMEARNRRYDIFVSSIMVLLEQSASKTTPPSLSGILDSVLFALGHERENFLNASVVKRIVKAGQPFKIHAQDSSNTFLTSVEIPAENSVAGKVVEVEPKHPRAIVYVPSTKYMHGVLITYDKRGKEQRMFQSTRVIPSAFLDLPSSSTPGVLQCLLCIVIPPKKTDEESCAVLCLSGRKPDCLGALDFAAAKVAAILVSLVM